ncbi:serine--tRNA synthetase-like protein Slimp [Hylaeus volcanicus]|uniref:serine--tRNA synthetase-like protein Slimp n=1 Tax=Hylaeus volcanicus TaxID=313075 RepID=UPI0023B83839|nr:serine--tRNA synthetase-like protein Slimp [Hylaeus volcanicus]
MASCLPHFFRTCIIHSVVKHATVRHASVPLNFYRLYSSALYISGRKATECFSFLTPYLDFDNKLTDMDKLQRDLTSRGLNVDAEDVKKMWEFYKSLDSVKSRVEEKADDIKSKLRKYHTNDHLTSDEVAEFQKLTLQCQTLKAELRNIKEIIWDLSESVVERMLKLPNEIDEKTPIHSPEILRRAGALHEFSATGKKKNHIEIGRSLGLLEYKNPMQYYLCNDAALFEIGVLNYAGTIFSADNMIRVIGSDFSRSLVVEGSGLNHEDPLHAFVIDNHNDVENNSPNRMHLVGGASLIAFLAMHAKQLINPNHFPVKYFSTGKQYTPFPSGTAPIGLFTVCQTSAAHVFALVKDTNSAEYRTQFERLLNVVCQLYDNICSHYQIVVRPASELRPWETMRVSFELWSSFSQQYVEVGHISICGDYFSKRLLIAYQTPAGRDFPSIISGTVLSVPRLLGCLLEQNPEKFVIPSKVLEHMPAGNHSF